MQSLQPHVTQSQHGVRVILCGRLFQNTLKFLLTRPPLLLSQMQVAYEGPGIGVILSQVEYHKSDHNQTRLCMCYKRRQYLINLKGFFEPVRSFIEIPFVTSHCSETQITCGSECG